MSSRYLRATLISILQLVWVASPALLLPRSRPQYDVCYVHVEIEACLAIKAACSPALKPLFDKLCSGHDTVSKILQA